METLSRRRFELLRPSRGSEQVVTEREKYLKQGGDFANNEYVMGHKPLPKYDSAWARP